MNMIKYFINDNPEIVGVYQEFVDEENGIVAEWQKLADELGAKSPVCTGTARRGYQLIGFEFDQPPCKNSWSQAARGYWVLRRVAARASARDELQDLKIKVGAVRGEYTAQPMLDLLGVSFSDCGGSLICLSKGKSILMVAHEQKPTTDGWREILGSQFESLKNGT
jgi:hypothetical protein